MKLADLVEEEWKDYSTAGEEDDRMQHLLAKFKAIFEEPQGLPPPRSHDHAIPLLLGMHAVNIRSYRYPHF